tara:strand:- start:144 stop:578 length:435 start_codon:yes stop_codon:yes gene_type:complete
MWKVKVKSNFSFAKLLKELPKIIDSSLEDIGKDSANISKKNIDTVKHGIPLSITTQIARNEGFYVNNTRKPRTDSKIPLKYTETLYNSIKGNKKGLYMEHYGELHHKGITNKTATRPRREFIETTMSEKTEKKFYDNLKKGLKK